MRKLFTVTQWLLNLFGKPSGQNGHQVDKVKVNHVSKQYPPMKPRQWIYVVQDYTGQQILSSSAISIKKSYHDIRRQLIKHFDSGSFLFRGHHTAVLNSQSKYYQLRLLGLMEKQSRY